MPKVDQFWCPPRIWEGQTVFVIGGGPSLQDQDLSGIHDKPVLGINFAATLGRWVDVVYGMDRIFWAGRPDEESDEGFIHWLRRVEHPCWRVSPCRALAPYKDIKILKVEQRLGIDTRPGYVANWKHSGHGAINLAVNLGAKRIVLLGFDMRHDPERGHNWHEWSPKEPPKDVYEEGFVSVLESTVEPLEELGVEVVNATPRTNLDLWPTVTLREELERIDGV